MAGNLLVFLVGLFFLELGFGRWFHPDPLAELHIISNYEARYDASQLYPAPEAVLYRRDRYGLRGRYPGLGEIDILTLGGSTTDQRYITEGQTWQDVMARQSGGRWSVVNAGIDGQSSYGNLRDFELWFPQLPGLKAAHFLFYVGYNDLFVQPGTMIQDSLRNHTLGEFIRSRSALFHLTMTLQGWMRARQAQLIHGACRLSADDCARTPLLHDHATLFAPRVRAYRANLERLISLSQEAGAVPILVTQTCRWYKQHEGSLIGNPRTVEIDGQTLNGVDVYYLLEALNDAALEVARQRQVIAIDTRALDWEDDDFYDLAHNTPQGAEKLGRLLYDRLKDQPRLGHGRTQAGLVRGRNLVTVQE